MSSLKKQEGVFTPHIAIMSSAVTYTTFRRHPIFFWNKTHVRSVICGLIIDSCSSLLKTEYVDSRTRNSFLDKESAERYLGREIPEFEDAGKLYTKKMRTVNMYYICKECGHIGRDKKDIIFLGPFDKVSGPIKSTINSTCPHCNSAIVQMDIDTEPSVSQLKEDIP